MNLKINFSGRAINYTEDEIATVAETMRNAETLTQGKYLHEFESKFAQYQGVEDGSCLAVMNGTAALELCAQFCRFNVGDEVIIPVHTFTASAYPFIKHGATPVWADIDFKTRVINVQNIEKALTTKTKAVLVVHLYGFVADMQAIGEFCHKHGLVCIEDAAQAIGSTFNGQKAGSFGDMAAFSFHSHKNLTTLGEGGMFYAKDKQIAELAFLLRHNGHCSYNFERKEYWKPAMGNVDLPMLNNTPLMPSNYCIGEIECALGIKLLDRIDEINRQKRERAIKIIDALSDFPELEFHRVPNERHNYHLLVARMTTGPEQRDLFIKLMYEEMGIKCVVQYIPLNRYDFYRKLGYGIANCPDADAFFDSMISFPFQHTLTDEDIEYLIQSARKVMLKIRN